MAQIRVLLAVVFVLALCHDSLAGRLRPQSNRFFKRAEHDHPPLLYADTLYVWEDSSDCLNPLENDGELENIDVSSLRVFSDPSNGMAYAAQGVVCYIPNADFNGEDSFQYTACDYDGQCESALIRVHVVADVDAPRLQDDSVTVGEDEYSITVDVLANDEDVDGPYIDRRSFKIVSSPRHGQAYVTADRKIVYTPTWTDKVRYYGGDSIVYQICDQTRLCSEATLIIDVLDKCIACEKCRDHTNTFNLQRDRIHHFWSQKVYDSPDH